MALEVPPCIRNSSCARRISIAEFRAGSSPALKFGVSLVAKEFRELEDVALPPLN